MTIAIIGTGNVGSALAEGLKNAGHDVGHVIGMGSEIGFRLVH